MTRKVKRVETFIDCEYLPVFLFPVIMKMWGIYIDIQYNKLSISKYYHYLPRVGNVCRFMKLLYMGVILHWITRKKNTLLKFLLIWRFKKGFQHSGNNLMDIVSDWILTWICVIWAITLELYNNHVFFKEAWIILESLLNCCRTPHSGGSVCGADDWGQPILCGCVWPGHDQSGSLQAGRDRRNSFIWQ